MSGVFGLIRAFSEDLDTGGRILTAIIGILGVIVGFALLREPFQSIVVVAFVIGIYWVAHGIMEIFGAFSLREGRGWNLVLGRHLDRRRGDHPGVPDRLARDAVDRRRDLAGDPRDHRGRRGMAAAQRGPADRAV